MLIKVKTKYKPVSALCLLSYLFIYFGTWGGDSVFCVTWSEDRYSFGPSK